MPSSEAPGAPYSSMNSSSSLPSAIRSFGRSTISLKTTWAGSAPIVRALAARRCSRLKLMVKGGASGVGQGWIGTEADGVASALERGTSVDQRIVKG